MEEKKNKILRLKNMWVLWPSICMNWFRMAQGRSSSTICETVNLLPPYRPFKWPILWGFFKIIVCAFLVAFIIVLSQWLPIFHTEQNIRWFNKPINVPKKNCPIFDVFYTTHSSSTYWSHNLLLNLRNITHSNRLINSVSLIIATYEAHCTICCPFTC